MLGVRICRSRIQVEETIMAGTSISPSIQLLLTLIEQSYNKKSWHGTNLRGSIRGLTAREALWRPSSSRHNIWEIVVHCAYWKYVVRRRILGEKRGSFPLKGTNWFRRSGRLTDYHWRNDIQLMEQCHRSLPRSSHKTPRQRSEVRSRRKRREYCNDPDRHSITRRLPCGTNSDSQTTHEMKGPRASISSSAA